MAQIASTKITIGTFLNNTGQRLEEALEILGVSREALRDKIGVELSTISRYINGKREIPEPTLRLIASIYKISYTWLKDGLGEMFEAGALNAVETDLKVHDRIWRKLAKDPDLLEAVRILVEELPEADREVVINMILRLKGK
ncbi:helix-turn-helix domain-containing protein [Leptospira andrefontaineae]|uniref:XRE family transcriptional regulator n=1 Tax=Leptospira andrefontaineae TaxID=2484976 RepID=A0A4V3JFB4_9LEPT|nr:helix-turn-helix transcriptional regulator [Leptospira andrefontaineae]TGK36252.1 XRE family transcriptional regulator [Leptospira andrefontaineae]